MIKIKKVSTSNDVFMWKDKAYTIDISKSILTKWWKTPVSYFRLNSPEALSLFESDLEFGKKGKKYIDARHYKTMLKTRFLKNIMRGYDTVLIILLAVALISIVVVAGLAMYFLTQKTPVPTPQQVASYLGMLRNV